MYFISNLLLLMCAFVPSSFTDRCSQRYYTQLSVTPAAVHPIPTSALYMRRKIKSYISWFAAVRAHNFLIIIFI